MNKRRFQRDGHRARLLRVLGMGLVIAYLGSPELLRTGLLASVQRDELSYEDEMEQGLSLMRRHQYEAALKSFKRANDLRDKKSPECFLWMAEAYQGLEAYKNVAESCEKVIELAGSDNRLKARAYNLKGIALQTQAGKDQKRLHEAKTAFRQGLELSTDLPILHYNLGFTLLQEGHDPEGIAELRIYVKLQPGDVKADEALKMIGNPRRAREHYAPDFSVTTSEGEYISLEDLRGKVVLLDFWGTWCAPCVASVPSLRLLHKRFEKEPLVMIGISSDTDAEKWREFTVQNRMVWAQYLDKNRKVQMAFEIHAYPTYIVIDHEGIVRYRSSGMSWQKDAVLEDAVRKQLKLATKL